MNLEHFGGLHEGGAVCVGCGCTDRCACEGGCCWLNSDGVVGVCSCCNHALPAFEAGANLAGWVPETPPGQLLVIQLDGWRVHEYRPGTGQPEGIYYALNEDAGTVRLVDHAGCPAVAPQGVVQFVYTPDWEAASKAKTAEAKRRGWLPREPSPDQKRGEQRKQERRRAAAKAAKKARQAQRRRS